MWIQPIYAMLQILFIKILRILVEVVCLYSIVVLYDLILEKDSLPVLTM